MLRLFEVHSSAISTIDLSELGDSGNLTIGVVDYDELPVTILRIEDHLVNDTASTLDNLVKINLQLQILLVVVAHEL